MIIVDTAHGGPADTADKFFCGGRPIRGGSRAFSSGDGGSRLT